jgi:hypothetical protein
MTMAPDNNEIHRALGRLEGKMDSILTTVSEAAVTSATRHKEFHEKHEELDGRLRTVENKLNWYAGVGVVVGFLFTQAIAPLKRLFGV